jgi:hypothetical protein
MKRFICLAALALLAAPVAAQDVGVGVNVTIGQPGFYGQIILGNAPPPEVIYAQPVIVAPGPMAQPPIYLRVPPGHERHWRQYCHRYHACNRPVYFVRDRWYNDVYVPHYHSYEREYRSHHGEWRDRREDRRYDRREGSRSDRRDAGRRDDDRRDHGRGDHDR